MRSFNLMGVLALIVGLLISCTEPGQKRQTVAETWGSESNQTVASVFSPPVYDRNVFTQMVFSTSLSQENCRAIGQTITVDYELFVAADHRPASGRHSTRRFVVDDYDPKTDTVFIRLGDEITPLGRTQPLTALHREIIYDAAGNSRTFSNVGDFFLFEGVSGENPNHFCFAQVGTSKDLYLEIPQ